MEDKDSVTKATVIQVAPIGIANVESRGDTITLSVTTISTMLEGKPPPSSMDTIEENFRCVHSLAEGNVAPWYASQQNILVADGEFHSDEFAGIAEVDAWNGKAERVIEDRDGDGIPDLYDKYPGQTIADVAAKVNKLGKYAKTNDAAKKIFSKMKQTLDKTLAMLGAIATWAAENGNAQQEKKAKDRIEDCQKELDKVKEATSAES
ncbi:MAG: hypothetical protein LBT64_03425 [Puniceicoccales bacterium]|jgi:hypothetical protein|nr:hypothetical protein [Puniceicoccales bacterium]